MYMIIVWPGQSNLPTLVSAQLIWSVFEQFLTHSKFSYSWQTGEKNTRLEKNNH